MKTSKKFLAVLMAAAMLLSTMAVTVSAAGLDYEFDLDPDIDSPSVAITGSMLPYSVPGTTGLTVTKVSGDYVLTVAPGATQGEVTFHTSTGSGDFKGVTIFTA